MLLFSPPQIDLHFPAASLRVHAMSAVRNKCKRAVSKKKNFFSQVPHNSFSPCSPHSKWVFCLPKGTRVVSQATLVWYFCTISFCGQLNPSRDALATAHPPSCMVALLRKKPKFQFDCLICFLIIETDCFLPLRMGPCVQSGELFAINVCSSIR